VKGNRVTEESFQSALIDLAHVYGYRVAHFRKARKKNGGWITPVSADGKGFLDLILVNRDKKDIIFAELKSEDGRMPKSKKSGLLIWVNAVIRCIYGNQVIGSLL